MMSEQDLSDSSDMNSPSIKSDQNQNDIKRKSSSLALVVNGEINDVDNLCEINKENTLQILSLVSPKKTHFEPSVEEPEESKLDDSFHISIQCELRSSDTYLKCNDDIPSEVEKKSAFYYNTKKNGNGWQHENIEVEVKQYKLRQNDNSIKIEIKEWKDDNIKIESKDENLEIEVKQSKSDNGEIENVQCKDQNIEIEDKEQKEDNIKMEDKQCKDQNIEIGDKQCNKDNIIIEEKTAAGKVVSEKPIKKKEQCCSIF